MPDNRAMLVSRSRVSIVSCVVLGTVALFAATIAEAQPAPADGSLRDRFPPASITSVERADAALDATAGAKGRIELEYRTQARECSGRFLVNECLDAARETQRKRLADIDAVELEANRYKRRDKADRTEADRARREAERAAGAAGDAEMRARNRTAYEARQADAARRSAEATKARARNGRPAIATRSTAPSGPDAEQRRKNAEAQAQKVSEAAAHRRDIERRIAASAERKRRQDEKKGKDAKTAAVPR